MMPKFRFMLGVLAILIILGFSAVPVLADTLVSQVGGSPISITDNNTIETVFVVGTDAHIAGTVTDVILAVNGNVYLEPNAQVDLVIDLGGHVYNSSLKNPKTGIFELNLTRQIMNDLVIGGVMVFGLWFIKVILSIAAIILLTGLGFLFSKHMSYADTLLKLSFIRLLGIGTIAGLVVIAIIVGLCLTIFGIPIAGFVLIASIVTIFLGLLPIMDQLGKHILSLKIQEYPTLTRKLMESILLVSLASIPFIGGLFLLGLGIAGFGLMITLGWARLREQRNITI